MARKLAILMPLMCAVLIAKLIIPLSIPSPLSVQNIFAAQDPQTAIESLETNGAQPETYTNDNVVIDETDTPNFLQNQPAAETTNISVLQNIHPAWQPSAMDIAALIWMIGVVVLTIFVAISNLRFGRMLRRNRPYTAPEFDELLTECKQAYNINKHLSVIRVSGINTAAVCSIFKPKLLISPHTFDALSTEEKRHILMHELAHIKGRDTLTCLILTVVNIVHWFNPFVWIAFIMMRQDLEVICDAHVIQKIGNSEKHSYASTLISLLKTPSSKPLPLVTALFIQKSSIKRRIKMISRYKKRTPLYTALALVLTIIVAVTGCTTAVEDTELVTQADISEGQPDGQTTDIITPQSEQKDNYDDSDIGKLICSYTLDFSDYADDDYRIHNITKAIDIVDGTIIPSGEQVDFFTEDTITPQNGWKKAPSFKWSIMCNTSDHDLVLDEPRVGGGLELVSGALSYASFAASLDYITSDNPCVGLANWFDADVEIRAWIEDNNIIVNLYVSSNHEDQ